MARAVMPVGSGTAPKSVRVSRNGNARTLSIPAEIAEAAHIDYGDIFQIAVVGDTLVYRRQSGQRAPGTFAGEGAERVFELQRRAGMAVGSDPSPVPPIDWDF
jgi:antitoxin component of MazEF toxin-antitoxin module